MTERLHPGLLVLHGNRLEDLAEASFAWLASRPLGPLEEESFLTQSNGMAEWLKMALAGAQGICAATRVELPARFVWRAYRAVLGRAAVPSVSPLDKLPLTWRLMRLLPALAGTAGFEPVAGFLGAGDADRRLQLAQRIADLFDQYQVYRSDWLRDWGRGDDRLRIGAAGGASLPVPAPQRWQPALWRAVLDSLTPHERNATRGELHRRFLAALQARGPWPQLPRRLVLFGTTHIPQQTLEAIAALAQHTQVLMAVPNPCRYHWADLIEGRELLQATRRRHPLRRDLDLSAIAPPDLHAHGHPLLAAWGRQSRDFVRQLDAFDDVQLALSRFEVPRVDLFDDGPGDTLLAQVQARIRDLVPLAEHPPTALSPQDRSVVFHVAHSAQREVEILHDQLLHLLAHPPGGRALDPRDIVVMVPDIETFAPAIRSVFGQHGRGHPRHIPWGIADQRDRGHHPLLIAVEWLLRAPRQRFTTSEVRDLLDVPAVARRFNLAAEDLPTLLTWIEGAGVRWGLQAQQREALGLGACGESNTWRFGLHRLLLGYATGELAAAAGGHAGIEPHAEVAGLSAGLAGTLAELLGVLEGWWVDSQAMQPPESWVPRLRALLQAVFAAVDDADRALLAALDEALAAWLQACEAAGFDEPVGLDVVREAWLDAFDAPGASPRFKAGGVTFCTLLPMRAIPFEVVCLLGMNDGDYPRRASRSDFDLMATAGVARSGDRSRRDDDRQLMLDALLSARRVLYLGWAGRSQRDNQPQPPSVLVAQLRDYLAAGWGAEAVAERTTEHPLQPFSRRYVESPAPGGAAAGLFTYAAEWRSAHDGPVGPAAASAPATAPDSGPWHFTVDALARFLRNPVKAFFRRRLQVGFDESVAVAADDETFASAGLEHWQLLDEVLDALRRSEGRDDAPAATLASQLEAQVARLARAGRLPLGAPGVLARTELLDTLRPMIGAWQAQCAAHPQIHDKRALAVGDPAQPELRLEDWQLGLRSAAESASPPTWIELQAGRLAERPRPNRPPERPRPDKLLGAWVRSLALAASGQAACGLLIGADAVVRITPCDAAWARDTLLDLLQAARQGLSGDAPLPTAVLTGLSLLKDENSARAAFDGSEYSQGEGREACLARLYPEFAALRDDPGFAPASSRLYAPYRRWLTEHVKVSELPDPTAADGGGDD